MRPNNLEELLKHGSSFPENENKAARLNGKRP